MDDPIAWFASAATLVAAGMTAANLGPRITGSGFVIFAAGSIAWCLVAWSTGQDSLLLTNAVLLLVNVTGIWRWLGRELMLERGRKRAVLKSLKSPVPSLFSSSAVVGAEVNSTDGEPVGRMVDLMIRCEDSVLSYAVVSRGGVAGVGEELLAIPANRLTFSGNSVTARFSPSQVDRLPRLERDNWPARPAMEG